MGGCLLTRADGVEREVDGGFIHACDMRPWEYEVGWCCAALAAAEVEVGEMWRLTGWQAGAVTGWMNEAPSSDGRIAGGRVRVGRKRERVEKQDGGIRISQIYR